MKKITTQLWLVLGFFFTLSTTIAQEVSITAASDTSACDGAASLMNSNQYSGWYWTDNNGNPIGQNMVDIIDLCPGTYTLNYSDTLGNSDVYTFIVDAMGSNDPCANSSLMVYIEGINPSGPNACDGQAIANISGVSGGAVIQWSNGDVTETASQLCSGTYSVYVSDSSGCSVNATIDIFADSSSNPCNIYVYGTATNVMDTNACDGSISLEIYGGTAPYNFIWMSNGTTVENDMSFVDSLCAGVYSVEVIDANNCISSTVVTVGDDANTMDPLDGYVYSFETSADGVCDGMAEVSVWGGVPPYAFAFSDGTSMDYAEQLCAGMHNVQITDASGQVLYLDFLVGSPDNTYNTDNYADSVIIDTVASDIVVDCVIDYALIDSIYISAWTTNDATSLSVVWTVVYDGTVVSFDMMYDIFGGNGYYDFMFQLFCPNKATGYTAISHDRLLFGSSSSANVNTMEMVDFKLYPNPIAEQINIALPNAENAHVMITDLAGKVIFENDYNQQNIQIDGTSFANGNYILNVTTATGSQSQLFTK